MEDSKVQYEKDKERRAKMEIDKKRGYNERMEQLTQRMIERTEKDRLSKSKVREILRQKPMYQQMEEEHLYNEFATLEEQKRMLEEKRLMHGPSEIDNILEH